MAFWLITREEVNIKVHQSFVDRGIWWMFWSQKGKERIMQISFGLYQMKKLPSILSFYINVNSPMRLWRYHRKTVGQSSSSFDPSSSGAFTEPLINPRLFSRDEGYFTPSLQVDTTWAIIWAYLHSIDTIKDFAEV